MSTLTQISRSFAHSNWGLRAATGARAARVDATWRLPVLAALIATIPAFYLEMLAAERSWAATLAYLGAALVTAAALAHVASHCTRPAAHVAANGVDVVLACGLLVAAALPPSHGSPAALGLRLCVALVVLFRMVWTLRRLIARGSLAYLLLLAVALLAACGAGFWWLEPTVGSFGDGLWLAFTTAATVGYGDIIPTTAASRIFVVFVVLLGFGMLSTLTAAIAAAWIETEERKIEREILHDLRHQIGSLRTEIAALRGQRLDADGDAAQPEVSACACTSDLASARFTSPTDSSNPSAASRMS